MSLSQRVAFNTLVQGLGRMGVILATVLTTAILTRLLGISGFGNYIFITSFIVLFTSISDWGTGIISIREAAKGEIEEEKIFGNAFILRFFLALFSFLVVNLLARIFPVFKSLTLATTIASFLLFLHSLRTSCQIIFQAKLRFENQAITETYISGLFLFFLILALRIPLDLSLVILLLLLANLLGTFLALFLSRRLASFDINVNGDILKKIFFEALPTGALLFIFGIYNRLDIVLLQIIKGSEAVGIYGLAYKVHDNLILGAAYLATALFPVFSRYVDKEGLKDRLVLIYRKSFDVLFLAGASLAVVFFVFAPFVIAVIGGPSFSGSVPALRILVFATFIAYFNHLTGYILIALGKQKVSLVVAIIALIWNIGLNLILIPRYSYLAAAGVTIATEGLVLILTSLYLAKNFQLKPSLTFPKTFVEIVKTKGKIF